MSWVVYMLSCADGSLYTGMTNDLERRLKTHASGKGGAYTRSRLPVRLVYVKRTRSLSTALKREAALKRLSREEKVLLITAVDGLIG